MNVLVHVVSPHEGHKQHIMAHGGAWVEQANFNAVVAALKRHYKAGRHNLDQMLLQGQLQVPRSSSRLTRVNDYITFIGQVHGFLVQLMNSDRPNAQHAPGAIFRLAGQVWEELGISGDQINWAPDAPGSAAAQADLDADYDSMLGVDLVLLQPYSMQEHTATCLPVKLSLHSARMTTMICPAGHKSLATTLAASCPKTSWLL